MTSKQQGKNRKVASTYIGSRGRRFLKNKANKRKTTTTKNSQVKVKKKKKMEREHSGFLSAVTVGTWSCVGALDM